MVSLGNSYANAVKELKSSGKFKISLGLERIKQIMVLFDNPQDDLNIIHIAGTNGKGSTTAMLSAILTTCGYTTGMFTSPHLVDFTERFRLNEQDITEEDFCYYYYKVKNISESNNIDLTEFEILTAMCFLYFKDKNIDFLILETGLGGRLDATNIIKKPLASIITSISLDHADRLGDTIDLIAYEKAGIIKQNSKTILNKDNNGIDILLTRANELESEILYAEAQIDSAYIDSLTLQGEFQKENLALVLKTIDLLVSLKFNIPKEKVLKGLKTTFWPARLQYIEELDMIIDGAHNLDAAIKLRETINKAYSERNIVWIISMINNKDYKNVIKTLISSRDKCIFTKSSDNINFVAPQELKSYSESLFPTNKLFVSDDLVDAFQQAKNNCNNSDLIVMAGSLYIAGSFLGLYKQGKLIK